MGAVGVFGGKYYGKWHVTYDVELPDLLVNIFNEFASTVLFINYDASPQGMPSCAPVRPHYFIPFVGKNSKTFSLWQRFPLLKGKC